MITLTIYSRGYVNWLAEASQDSVLLILTGMIGEKGEVFGRMPLCAHISAMTATTVTTRSDGCTRMSITLMCTIGEWATACRRCALELDS